MGSKDVIEIKIPKRRKEKGGGSKKYGRNMKKCQKYRLEGRREINRKKRHARNAKRETRMALRRVKRAEFKRIGGY